LSIPCRKLTQKTKSLFLTLWMTI